MTAMIPHTHEAAIPAVPTDQRDALLDCHWRDLEYALDWALQTDDRATQLARLRYLRESAERLEAAISALSPDRAEA